MADIPKDILDSAWHLVINYNVDDALLAGAIAAAILAERERCAQIADSYPTPERAIAGRMAAMWVARAIRA